MGNNISYVKSARMPLLNLEIPVRFREFYFELATTREGSDVDACLCLSSAVPGWRAVRRSTRIIDLSAGLDTLFASCSKNNRYKIERARQRDAVKTEFLVAASHDQVSEFAGFYDAFAGSKGIQAIRRSQVEAMARAGNLAISFARDREGVILAAHSYFFGRHRARLTHSASLFRLEGSSGERNRIGRTNRLLHWDDIIRFREAGATTYDLGGWYTGNSNDALLRINSFKEEFGGQIVEEWDLFRARSMRGFAYLNLRDLRDRIHRARG
jgi:hypothetical protein